MSEVDRYSEASGSKINRDKCQSLWLGEGDPGFDLPDTLPGPQDSAKVLGIEFGHGDYPMQNWDGRLKIAAQKVDQWMGWSLTLRERVYLIKTYLLPLLIYLGSVCMLPEPLWTRVYSLFFQLLWGNRLHLIKREVTYRMRRQGGLCMVSPVVFLVNTFLKINVANLWKERAPPWVYSCRGWFRPFFQEWETGGQVKDLRTPHGHLPAYATPVLKVIRRWGLGMWEIRTMSRKLLDKRVLLTHFQKPLALRDCPSRDLGVTGILGYSAAMVFYVYIFAFLFRNSKTHYDSWSLFFVITSFITMAVTDFISRYAVAMELVYIFCFPSSAIGGLMLYTLHSIYESDDYFYPPLEYLMVIIVLLQIILFFGILWFLEWFFGKKTIKRDPVFRTYRQKTKLKKNPEALEGPEDVVAERERVETLLASKNEEEKPVIIVDALRKEYQVPRSCFQLRKRKKAATKNISFHVRKGEVLGLLGPNGAGKTTSMYMLAGEEEPTAGNSLLHICSPSLESICV
ncbi:hypothetical protein GDO81_025598 [Engystomops pustulosus]|uniref:ABC transporter domain-containing protein n=1 Tax=Engystomops pustulosus TaxID=76066 RepID=A0AAV6Z4B0_ENGPU|nr:hypothetical protein GDO81_025598 [Engystomops pustulosus]